ncbi:TonB-dependent receptor [Chitinophaga lutea]|uniref:TonB-dependent receptor n=1 Tax=Chitinophaga lutea TaxID=2488634 RepID=A0A3N4QAE7_9BACT|nr:TonB-dependent receptor [Chitinophaga lutea]RPE12970.1 TonB-dependent receptor [Chitinophaga lutea]
MKFLVHKTYWLCLTLAWLLFPFYSQAQQKTVTGKVRADDGGTLIGVSVAIKGTTTGTTTNASGEYRLEVPSSGATLVFTMMGYLKQEQAADGGRLDVVLKTDPKALEEVVVVGYGTQKRSDVTGSIFTVSSKKIQEVPVTNAAAALQGRVPGVLVDKGGNRPGEGVRVQIRGRRSFQASNDPLYVIDGIPIDAGINDIDPDDIETMEVLKDASATAIYGSRGANGVILITTRRGRAGKLSVRYGGYLGIDEPINVERRMNAAEFVAYRRESKRADKEYPEGTISLADDLKMFGEFGNDRYVMDNIRNAWAGGAYDPSKLKSTDWGSFALRDGFVQDHSLSLTAGTEMTKVFFAVGYQNQKGIIHNQDFGRWSARLTVDQQVTKSIKVGMVNYFSYSKQNYGSDLFQASAQASPMAPTHDENGNLIPVPSNDTQTFNILFDLNGITRERLRSRYLGSFYGEIKLPFNFRYRLNLGIDYGPYREGQFESSFSSGRKLAPSYGRVLNENRFNYNLQNLLYWDLESSASNKHQVNVTLGQEVQGFRFENSEIEASDFPYEAQKWYNLSTASKITAADSELRERKLASFLGRVNYGYDNRYLLTASIRADGSSVLAEGHKWSYFPSASIAWRISQESFLKDNAVVNELKLRVGYGVTGNAAVSPYSTQGSIEQTRYVWENQGDKPVNGFRPDNLPNSALGWENTATTNVAIEFGFLKNRINGSVDVYRQKTSNLLMDRALPPTSGFDNILQNVGETSNSGVEIALNTMNIATKDFQWRTEIVFTANRERIERLYQGRKDDIGNRWFIGHPIQTFYTERKIGIWQNTPEDKALMDKYNAAGSSYQTGMVKVADINNDGKITTEDREIIGTANPKWTGSISNSFNYKGWDLSFFFVTRQQYILENHLGLTFQGRYNTPLVDYWTPENPTNKFPRPHNGYENPPANGAMYFEDGSHVRLKNVSLGYKLPSKLLKRAGISSFRVYATGTNLYIWSKDFNGLDPEVFAESNSRPVRSPSSRSYVFGVNVEF